jgi:DNA invertase Pin-like site-specific DNA recombinase
MTTALATAIQTATLTGREYLRVSTDKSGVERSPEEQHDENVEATARHNIELGQPYRDVGSASDYGNKIREDFTRLVADLESGAFGADVLVLWTNSRASRQPREWIKVADACRARGILIFITTEHRAPLYDPRRPRDYADLIDEAVKAMRRSTEISEQVVRALDSNLRQGKPQGQTPWGYKREYDMTKVKGRTAMRPVGQMPDPETAPLVVELFQRLKAGDAFLKIARDWKERGIRNKSGAAFSAQHLAGLAKRVAYVGLRIHGEETVPASWPVISAYEGSPLTPGEFTTLFHEVQVILAAPSRKTAKPGAGRHVFSAIIKCDVCGGPTKVDKGTKYICRAKGCISIAKDAVDEVVSGEIVNYLARPAIYSALADGPDDSPELASVRAQLAEKRASLAEMEAAPKPKSLTAVLLLADSIDALKAEITPLEEREAELAAPPALAGLVPTRDVAGWWEANDTAVRRQVAAIVLTPGLLGEVRVQRGAGRPVAERLKWVQND